MKKLLFGKPKPETTVDAALKTLSDDVNATEEAPVKKPIGFGNFGAASFKGKKPQKVGASAVPTNTPLKVKAKSVAAFGTVDLSSAGKAKADKTITTEDFDDIAIPGVGVNAASLAKYQHPLQPENPSDLQTLEFNSAMDKLSEAINTKSIAIPDNTTEIRQMMAATPHFAANLHPDDFGLLVRALRMSYGNVKTKKVANKAKTSARATRVNSIVDSLDLGF